MVSVLRWPAVAFALALCVAALGVVMLRPSVASACGGFFSRKVVPGPRRPSLAYERTLVIFDQEKRREHFIREVSFRAAREPFGFVVPAPARPEVASQRSPFDTLERKFPFETLGLGLVGSTGGGAPTRSRSKAAGVTVLETKRVGSFDAFVLAADDEHALTGWLEKNGFSTTPESARWLAHYVRMKFFYVAMRYTPPPGLGNVEERTSAETIRVSFDTPVAYYPYYEPDPAPGASLDAPRMLELWFVSQSKAVPIAARAAGSEVRWVRPMESGRVVGTSSRSLLQAALGEAYSFVPAGPVVVQTFIDQKRSRLGYGDVLFVPDAPATPNVDVMRPLFPILDPSLLPPAPERAEP